MKRILDKRGMTEQDWQEYRKQQKGIGGSDVATILGLNPYKTAFTLWLEKTGQIESPEISNQYIEWGNLLEPVIREKFAQETGFQVMENPYVLQHDEHDFMVANLDGEVVDDTGERGILEIKTASERMAKDWENGIPNHYMLQIQHYLAVTGYKKAWCACLIGGNNFKYYQIERDDYIIDAIISAEMDFMLRVKNGVAPEISGHSADSDYLASAYPEANGEEAFLEPYLEAYAIRYDALQQEIKALQAEADYLKNRIKLEAKEYGVLRNERVKISMPTIKKTNFNSKQFAADYPELFEKYKTLEISYRSFAVNLDKEEI